MSDHHHVHQQGGNSGFEREDLGGRPVYGFMISLAVAGVVIYYVLWGVFRFLDAYERKQHATKSPLVQSEPDTRIVPPGRINEFPQPRLETDELGEINEFRLHDEQILNSYGWVDQNAGVMHIPIDRAMQLVADRGLPTNPKAGTTPTSTVQMVNQAAASSDSSQKSPAKNPPGTKTGTRKGKSQ